MIRSTLVALLFASLATTAIAFDLQGHRGARGLMPENTLPAFAKALSTGVSTLELDVGITRDGVVIVSHNPALDPDITRDSKGNWIADKPLIKTLTFEELQKFDVGRIKGGSRVAKRFPQQEAVDGTRLPSLDQVFALAEKAGNKNVRFNIETKINPTRPEVTVDPMTFANALLVAVKKHGMESRVTIQSFDWRTLQIVQGETDDIETVYLSAQQDWMDTITGQNGDWTAGFKVADHGGSLPKMIKAAGGDVWSPFHGDVTKEKIKEAHDLGLKVIPWTVNDEETMRALVDAGVDGLISDYPDVLRKVLQEKRIEVPAATPVDP